MSNMSSYLFLIQKSLASLRNTVWLDHGCQIHEILRIWSLRGLQSLINLIEA